MIMQVTHLLLALCLLILGVSQTFSGTLTASIQTKIHIYSVTGGPIVNLRFQKVTGTVSYPSMLMQIKKNSDPGPSSASDLQHKIKIENTMDYQSMYTDRHQYCNIAMTSGLLYIRVTDFDSGLNKRYNIFVSESSSLQCRPCFGGSTRVSSTNCLCKDCPNGYFGFYCDLPFQELVNSQPVRIVINTNFYFLVLRDPVTPQISYQLVSNTSQVGALAIQLTKSFTELAGIPNVAPGRNDYAVFAVNNLSTSLTVFVQSDFASVGLYFADAGPRQVVIVFVNTITSSSSNYLVIAMGVMGGLLGIGLIIALVFLVMRYKNRTPEIVMPVREDRFTAEEIQRYYPAVVFESLESGPMQDCVICLCPIEIQNVVRVVYCGHAFHSNCLLNWFRKHLNCPYCRQDCTKETTLQLYQEIKNQHNGNNLLTVQLAKAQLLRKSKIVEVKEDSSKINFVNFS